MRLSRFLLLALPILFTGFANAVTCGPGHEVSERWQIAGEALQSGDSLELTIGGYTVSYTINDFSANAAEWSKFLALEVKSAVPDTLVKAGAVAQNYTPV